jgi:hypothetical protein
MSVSCTDASTVGDVVELETGAAAPEELLLEPPPAAVAPAFSAPPPKVALL